MKRTACLVSMPRFNAYAPPHPHASCMCTLQVLLDDFVTEQAAAFLVLLRAKVGPSGGVPNAHSQHAETKHLKSHTILLNDIA